MLSRLSILIATTLSLALSLAARSAAAATDFSVRIGTFNAYMLPPYYSGIYDDTSVVTAGAHRLAQRILASDYDIIVINEAWDEDAKEILRQDLILTYPNTVLLIDADQTTTDFQDAGLMLFAKPHLVMQDVSAATCGDCTDGSCDMTVFEANGGGASLFLPPEQHVLFHEYSACEGDDCYAAKGVGFVRFQDVNTGFHHDVFFTHTQATYADEYDTGTKLFDIDSVLERQNQMAEIKSFFDCIDGHGVIDDSLDSVYLLGDFNIDGDATDSADSWGSSDAGNNKGEWSHYMEPGATAIGGFFSDHLRDEWAFSNLQRDFDAGLLPDFEVGISYPTDDGCFSGPSYPGSSDTGCRLDYILTNRPIHNQIDNPTCNQHMTMAVNLQDGNLDLGGIGFGGHDPGASDGMGGSAYLPGWYSDHIGVNANFNRMADQCSPLDPTSAATVYGSSSAGIKALTDAQIGVDATGAPTPSNPGQLLSGTITNPGNVQWWRLDRSGEFLIGLGDDKNDGSDSTIDEGFRVDVYHHDNLTVPIAGYKGEKYSKKLASSRGATMAITGMKYQLLDPPYYIKVYNENNSFTGTYQWGVHALTCSNKGEEGCIIFPNTKLTNQKFPTQSVTGTPTMESLYYELDVQQPTALTAQNLKFIASDSASSLNLQLTVVGTASDTPVRGPAAGCGAPINGDYAGCNQILAFNGFPAPADASGERLFMRVKRLAPVTTGGSFAVTWWTSLTAFYGGGYAEDDSTDVLLSCLAENDWSERDEIKMRVAADGLFLGPDDTTNGFWIGMLDEDGDARGSQRIDGNLEEGTGVEMPYLFTSSLRVDLVENEDICDSGCVCHVSNDDCEFEPVTRTISPLPFSSIGDFSAETRPQVDYKWTSDPDDGHYKLDFNASHGTQQHDPPTTLDPLTTTSVVLSPGTYGAHTASKAIDGSASTWAASTSGVGSYWWADLGAPRYVQTVEVTNVPAGAVYPAANLANFAVETSMDNINWTANPPYYFPGTMSAGAVQPFNIGFTARFVRIRMNATTAKFCTPAEVRILGW